MVTCTLVGFRVAKATLDSKINQTRQVQLAYSFSFRLSVNKGVAVGTLCVTVKSRDEDSLLIHLETEGVFEFMGVELEEDRKELHDLCFDTQFGPTAKQTAALGAMAGLTNIKVPKPDVNRQEIQLHHPIPAEKRN